MPRVTVEVRLILTPTEYDWLKRVTAEELAQEEDRLCAREVSQQLEDNTKDYFLEK